MSPFVWKLCGTPVLGVLAWAANLCAIPPLIEASNVSLAPGRCPIDANVTTPVPVRKGYQPSLMIRRAISVDTSKDDEKVYAEGTTLLASSKQAILFKVTVTNLVDGRLVSNSVAGLSSRTAFNQTIDEYALGGLIWLVPGRYHIAICTLHDGIKGTSARYDIAVR